MDIQLSKKVNQWALKKIIWIKVFTFIACLCPFIYLAIQAVLNHLGANPVEKITHFTGTCTLVFLCLTLLVTPVRKVFGLPFLLRIRRMLGLYAFFYVTCHLLTWILFDRGLEWSSMVPDIYKRPFITIGMSAFILMIPMALTSFNRAIRWLGGKKWQRIHYLIYPVAILGVVHYYWLRSAKHNFGDVYPFMIAVSVLLGYRVVVALLKSDRPSHNTINNPVKAE